MLLFGATFDFDFPVLRSVRLPDHLLSWIGYCCLCFVLYLKEEASTSDHCLPTRETEMYVCLFSDDFWGLVTCRQKLRAFWRVEMEDGRWRVYILESRLERNGWSYRTVACRALYRVRRTEPRTGGVL